MIEDHGLDQRAIFRADAFAGVLIGSAPGETRSVSSPTESRGIRVRMTRRGVPAQEFVVHRSDLSLFPDDPASPWLLVPPPTRVALRRMQDAGPPLGAHEGLRVRRGVMTGANDVLVCSKVEPKLGGLSRVEAEGYRRSRNAGESAGSANRYRATIETGGLRPIVRGADIDAFRFAIGGHLIWSHDGAAPGEPGPRVRRYLERHRSRLEGRSGYRPGLPLGAIFRLAPETLGPKVAWHDLSDTVRAVALPATVPFDGVSRELVPLNTVYFLPTPDHATALLLAGLLNSLPVRSFARAVAERAKDARFRFFAWTLSAVPLPLGWREDRRGEEIRRLSLKAHQQEGVSAADQLRLDRAVAGLFGLEAEAVEALVRFDAWLKGEP